MALARRCVNEHLSPGRVVHLEPRYPQMLGMWDEARLSRVLGNLLDNALKFSERDQAVVVTMDEDDGGNALLCVRDEGVGIPPDDLPRVFERFYRGQNALAQAGGTGLGLAVARQIVEQHGGSVSIESRPGSGTVGHACACRARCGGDPRPRCATASRSSVWSAPHATTRWSRRCCPRWSNSSSRSTRMAGQSC